MRSLYKFLKFDTYGRVAIAALYICTLSGVFLIVPFDPSNAYASVTAFVLSNPAASLSRNLHYWSAQLFLIFTILHFAEHFKRADESLQRNKLLPGKGISKPTWMRLVLSMLVVFYVMLSGFILKDDADSRQAFLLFSNLLDSLPLAGEMISTFMTGQEYSLNVIYTHHAATSTILVFIVIFEHVKNIRVSWKTFIIISAFSIIISIIFRAPLAGLSEEVMKGPWYFVGVQEMLHLISEPLIVISILLLLLLLIYIAPFISGIAFKRLKYTLVFVALVYAILSLTGYFFRGSLYTFQFPYSNNYDYPVTLVRNTMHPATTDKPVIQISGGAEGCMSCHSGMKGFSEFHNPDEIGCYSCHGGDPFTLNKKAAHRNMYRVPGNISNAKETCINNGCHTDIVQRLPNSLMASLSGMIAVNKWVFNEIKAPDGAYHVHDLNKRGLTPSEEHLTNLCAGCHLGMEKTQPGKSEWIERGGGCNACHLTYDDNALTTLNEIPLHKAGKVSANSVNLKGSRDGLPLYHPLIDIKVTNDKCESCHSRSGRISMSYSGWHETRNVSDLSVTRQLPDGRIFTKKQADIHYEAGMLCIDCHGSYEVMGDGKKYRHKEEAVKISCEDCHPDELRPDLRNYAQLSRTDRESQLISWIRYPEEQNSMVILTRIDSIPVVNTRVDKQVLLRKSDNKELQLKPVSLKCKRDGAHKRLSCEACHTAWVPQCIGCHNTYEEKTTGFNMLTKKQTKGTWVEYIGEGFAEPPVLGIKHSDKSVSEQKVATFTPGMILTIDEAGNGNIFKRLYAPASGHTTQRKSRSCISCHLDPLAIGYGRGKLILENNGIWNFEPLYSLNKYDGLPEDAWIGFLENGSNQVTTRSNMRPFNKAEQQSILSVGACLTCHKEGSKVVELILTDFDKAKKQVSKKCIISKN